MQTVRPDCPLDPLTLALLKEVARVAKESAVDYFVIGATARDIILMHVFNVPTGRATRDVDFAIAVADWEQLENQTVGNG